MSQTQDWHKLGEHYGGWRPALPDHRRKRADTSGIKVLEEVDPRADLPPVFDQMQLGSCTANATAACFEYDASLDGDRNVELSRLFIYWQERNLEGSVGQGDTGAMGFDAFQAAATVGVCAEQDWPYDPNRYNDPQYFDPSSPPEKAAGDEGYYKLAKPYAHVDPVLLAVKQVLSNKQTIAFGFSVFESFEAPDVARTGIVPMPGDTEQQLGGHEVLLVGYLKDEPNYGLVRNSWGTGWGLDGYFLMPWTYLLSSQLSGDWATIQRPVGS